MNQGRIEIMRPFLVFLKQYYENKSPKVFIFHLLFILLNIHQSKIAFSDENNTYELLAGISLLNFGYKEYDINNVLLDKEDGTIPGITFSLTRHWQNWSIDIKLNNYKGIVAYTGQTNTSIPVTSKTDTNILDYSFSINRWFTTQNNTRFALYTGYGQHQWQRNIRATTTNSGAAVNGLDERYYWDYVHLGSKLELFKTTDSKWFIDIQYNYSLTANIDINFVGLDPVTLPLGETWGIRFSSPYKLQIDKKLFIKLEPYYEYWGIERSESKRLSKNGVLINASVVEPRSDTENFGINFSIIKEF